MITGKSIILQVFSYLEILLLISSGKRRVVVTKQMPGTRWLETLIKADCRVEIGTSREILSVHEIKKAIGNKCDAVIGQVFSDYKFCFYYCLVN